MSQMNRSEALRCIQIAKKCLQEGKRDKAEKFLTKSIRMYETVEAKQLLQSLQNPSASSSSSTSSSSSQPHSHSHSQSQSQSQSSASSNTNNGEDTAPQRPQRANTMPNLNRNSAASASTSSIGSQSSSRMTRDEEVNMVRQILRAKDFYDILGVPKNADESTLKKAYRKKALKCHPDRNKSPGAEEAFKKLSKAYDVLRDPRKKQIYDTYGEDSPQMNRNGNSAQFQQMTPDDIIRMFFGGDFGGGGFQHGGFHFHTGGFPQHRRRHQGGGGGDEQHGMDGGPMVYLMQLLPIILVFFTMILPSLMMFGGGSNNNSSSGGLFGGGSRGSSENVYFSLDRMHPFTQEKKTDRMNTVYYVQPQSRSQFGYYGGRQYKPPRLEAEVEAAYLTRLINACEQQIEKDNERILQITSNKIDQEQRRKLLKTLMKQKKKLEKYNNKQCSKLFEYVDEL